MVCLRKCYLFLFLLLFLLSFVYSEADSGFGNEIVKDNYKISRELVHRTILVNSFFDDSITIENIGDSVLNVDFSVSDDLRDFINFNESSLVIVPGEFKTAYFRIKGEELGVYLGSILLSGSIDEELPVNVTVSNEIDDPLFLIEAEASRTSYNSLNDLEFFLSVDKLKQTFYDGLNISYSLIDSENKTFFLGSDFFNASSSFSLVKVFPFPETLSWGDVVLVVNATTSREDIVVHSFFNYHEHILFIKLFGILPVWVLLVLVFLILLSVISFYFIRKHIQNKKKYRMQLVRSTLPKPNKDFFNLGKVAETNIPAYLEPERMKVHTIVAGATGGGKSISAQVIVEEALMHNVAVIVFDPTAQWSGMLRKCDDKKMMGYYPKFGMKPQDARAFPGSIRMVTDAREIIDVNKHAVPGQIQIFTLNKLDPSDIDIFVANVIREIFRSDPKEAQELKILLVFDEVHRLLSKFGGSGEGFLQIERACREFRKWGMGVMLVSQVLSDFMGEIKANINTEVQMRTRDEGDLERINTKYGEEFLQSLVKASVGVGMFVNQNYNKGKPYFVNFRPILHNTRRLTDEELEQYNKYNETADDLEFWIDELEKLKVDVFDLKMELKLVKDKIMTGSFAVVDIYLQGLKPRIDKSWEKLGKTPPKREKKLANLEEIKRSVEEAKKARAKFEAEQKKSGGGEEKKEEKLDVTKVIVKSLTFDNGMMVASLDELAGVLPDLDNEIFMITAKKNEFSTWAKEIDAGLSGQLNGKMKKDEVVKIINDFIDKTRKALKGDDEKKEGEEGGNEGGDEKKESEE